MLFLSVYGWSKNLLICYYVFFCVVECAGQKEVLITFWNRRRLNFACCFIISLNIWFNWNCTSFTWWYHKFYWVYYGLNQVCISHFCVETKVKFGILQRISSFVLLRCRNRKQFKGFVRFVMTTVFSLNVMSPFLDCISTVAKGAFNSPLATIKQNSAGRPSFSIVCGTSNPILRKSAPERAPDEAPASIKS